MLELQPLEKVWRSWKAEVVMSLSLHLSLIALISFWPSPHPVSQLGRWGFPVLCLALGTRERRLFRGLRFFATCDLALRDRNGQVAG